MHNKCVISANQNQKLQIYLLTTWSYQLTESNTSFQNPSLSVPVSEESTESSFSNLKFIENYLRSTTHRRSIFVSCSSVYPFGNLATRVKQRFRNVFVTYCGTLET